jgi:hypothetical protein
MLQALSITAVMFGVAIVQKMLKKVHLEYLKSVLCVRKNTNNVMVYIETGRLPMNIVRWFRVFKFWFKILQSENCILR